MRWKMCEAKGRGEDHHDPANEQKIINRSVVWQELWVKHLQSSILALTEALRMVEEWEEADLLLAGGNRTWTVRGLACDWPLLLVWHRPLLRHVCAHCLNFLVGRVSLGWSGFLTHSCLLVVERKRSPSSLLGDASVRRSSTGLVTWFVLTHCHDAASARRNTNALYKTRTSRLRVQRECGNLCEADLLARVEETGRASAESQFVYRFIQQD